MDDPRLPLIRRLARKRAELADLHRDLAEVSGPDVRQAHLHEAEDLDESAARAHETAETLARAIRGGAR